MKTYTADELKEVIRLHALCLADADGGVRANLSGADLSGADLSHANLNYANLSYADLSGKKIEALRVFTGLYRYIVWAALFQDGSRWVRMGCLWRSLEDWDKVGIRNSNASEYPDDGSEKCEERVRAFEFAKEAVLRMEPKAEGGTE
jgi:hypothetical protein